MQVHERAPEPSVASPRAALYEALLVFVAVSAATWLISRFSALPLLRTHLHLVVGTLFLVTAMRCAERLPGGLPRYGLSLGGLFADSAEPPAPGLRGAALELLAALAKATPEFVRELGVSLAVCAVIFPPFIFGFYVFHAPERPFAWLPQSDFVSYLLTQILVVGLPEEALFRGYLQGRLQDALPGRMPWLRVDASVRAWLLQAALFAVLHFVVDWQPARLAVFFPALLFGWVAARRGGIGAAVLVHAACNVLSDLLVRGWL